MTTQLTTAQVAADVQREDGPDAEGLIAAFRASPAVGKRILGELASHRDAVVRAWVAWAARRSLAKDDAVALTMRLAKDRDSDVRDVAVDELVELDRHAAAELAGALRRKLESKKFYEPITAMWALAAIRDRDSVPAIRTAASRWDNALHRSTAEVVSMLLEGRDDELMRRVVSHDHQVMPWLSKAVRLLGTMEAKRVLERCSREAPDEECRTFCREEVDRFRLQTQGEAKWSQGGDPTGQVSNSS